ncbi:hypothetical protein [Serratia sp. DD3]|uniref:hypothetical protein n=1 Tax=Serratia sp. DD3 TaxID=1410619 RepID=UPI0003C4F76F|nr:hypothetical protein [Serratia sp. DD3]KEY59218.1 hypothetical protein SRDD_19160 [Serratia sp. DD3]
MERSVLLHHLKTSCYAFSAVVLTGWVTDSLNEELIFKTFLRLLHPEEVERYSHPFTDLVSFSLWAIPLVFTTLLLLFASVMTLHHVKKPRLYQITHKKPLLHAPHVAGTPTPEQLTAFLHTYATAGKISLLVPHALQQEYQMRLASIEEANNIDIHLLKEDNDLQKIAMELEQWIKKEAKNRLNEHLGPVFFDITYSSPVRSSAALFCSLEQDIELIQTTPDGKLTSYDLVCKIQE